MTRDEVLAVLKVSRPTLYQWMRRDGFPVPIKVGPRENRWLALEVAAWLEARPRARVLTGA